VERRRVALELRKEGYPYRAIALVLVPPCSTSNAHKMVQTAIERIPHEAAKALKTLELSRLDALQRAFWDKAIAGDTSAGGLIVRIMGRRAKYEGLDAPVKVTTDVFASTDAFDIDEALG
jgi:hypothetical protein